MSAQDIQIDYKKDRNLRLNRTFTENYKVSILNFDKTSDLIVTDQSGDIIKIDSKDLRGYNYDSKLKRLVLMIEIGNGYLFINKDSLELGDLVFSASGETLLHISKIKRS